MSGTSTIELFARLAVSLAVVIGLMVGLSALLRRRGMPMGTRRAAPVARVDILARRALGRNASIAVVRAGGKSMVLGVTEASITMLAEAEIDEIDLETTETQWTGLPAGAPRPGTAWKAMLETLRERTVRKP